MPRPVRCIEGYTAGNIPFAELFAGGEPVLVKGALCDWPLVAAGMKGAGKAADYLKRFVGQRPITAFVAPPDTGGRFHYDEEVRGLNFSAERMGLSDFLDRLVEGSEKDDAERLYAGSTDLDTYLPGLRGENDLTLNHPDFTYKPPLASIWIGNRTIAPAHFDISNNLACVLVGRRRFTLFPPDQIANLYPGPIEPTPAGQVVTMVDFRDPDFERYPRFRDAMANAQQADMEPGDLLYYPALWWHQVEALEPFNVMTNYWWNATPAYVDTPETTMMHALLSLRDRPTEERRSWRAIFDYYVFGDASRATDHLPKHAQGALGQLDEVKARRLRAQILNRLNR